jgi:hypothetical protein
MNMIAYRRMLARTVSALVLAGAFVVVSAERADAALIVWICNDAACAAGGDTMVVDNGIGDTNLADGRISVSVSDGHASEFASSYPSAGSQTSPILSLNYDIDQAGFAAIGTPYFYATQDDFLAIGTLGIVANATAGGGTVNVFSGAGSFTPPGVAPIFNCALDCSGSAPTFGSTPYFLAIRVNPTAGTGGGARGDVTVQSVPDGGATATLLGSVLVAVGLLRRRYGNG